jgi:SOS-response transcriptional repressor LexA
MKGTRPNGHNHLLGYRETQVLGVIEENVRDEGRAPSYRMIRDELGIATAGEVCRIVKRLERRGILRRDGIDAINTRRGVRRLRIRLVNVLTV